MDAFGNAAQWLIDHGGAIGLLALFAILACVRLYYDGQKARDKIDELNEKRVSDLTRSTDVLNQLGRGVDAQRVVLETLVSELRMSGRASNRR